MIGAHAPTQSMIILRGATILGWSWGFYNHILHSIVIQNRLLSTSLPGLQLRSFELSGFFDSSASHSLGQCNGGSRITSCKVWTQYRIILPWARIGMISCRHPLRAQGHLNVAGVKSTVRRDPGINCGCVPFTFVKVFTRWVSFWIRLSFVYPLF